MSLTNLMARTRESNEGCWVYRYANGLRVKTDEFMRPDPARILPIGGPQHVIMNRLAHYPEIVRDKRVLDIFAGSGVLGLTALQLGAARVEFVDVNPRATTFQQDNCRDNDFHRSRYETIRDSVTTFRPSTPYDVLLANPPFVMTPPGITGTLTSAAGPTGDDLVTILLDRLDDLLIPTGQAYIFVLQLTSNGRPLIYDRVAEVLRDRQRAVFTPVQIEATPFDYYERAYKERFPAHVHDVTTWAAGLRADHAGELAVQHYILRIEPAVATSCTVTDDLASEYGADLAFAADSHMDLALGRVAENLILD